MLQGQVFWPGLQKAPIEFSYTVSHGGGAGVITLVVPVQDLSKVAQEGDMILTDGVNGSIVFQGCRLDSTNLVAVQGGNAVALHFLDRRWAWRFGAVSGYYNQRDPFPDPRPEGQIKFQIWVNQNIKFFGRNFNFDEFLAIPGQSEFIPGTERTPKQLMLLCLGAMYEPGNGIQFGAIPNEARPEIDWVGVNPAQALQSVADRVAARLIFQPVRNGVLIGPLASPKDQLVLPDYPIIARHPGVNPPDPPDTIICLGGPILVSDYWLLQAVGMEADGTMVPIDQLSYKPKGGWGNSIPGWDHWNNVTVGDSPDLDTSKALAKQFVWRTFRIAGAQLAAVAPAKPPQPGDIDYIPGGGHAPKPQAPFNQPVVLFGAVQHPRQIDLLDVEYDIAKDRFGQLKSKPAKLWADSYKLYGNQMLKGLNRDLPAELDVAFSIDQRGIITTDQPIYRVNLAGDKTWASVSQANVYIRCSAKIRDPITWQYVPGQWSLQSAKARPNVPPEVIQHPELQPVYVVTRNPRRGFRIALIENNLRALKEAANFYLVSHAAKYEVVATETVEFAGLCPIDPDRAVQQVTWSFGVGRAPTTTISIGTEHNPYVASYPERRRTDAINALITEDWVNRVLGRWQDGANK